jgi:hypothetical protein
MMVLQIPAQTRAQRWFLRDASSRIRLMSDFAE